MTGSLKWGASLLVAAVLVAGAARGKVAVRQDARNRVVALDRLIPVDPACGLSAISGVVAGRQFAADDFTLSSFIWENTDGSRQYVNVQVPGDMSRALSSKVLSGLQTLLRVGRRFSAVVQSCSPGAATFITLMAIQ